MSKGILFVVSAPSGCGKGAVLSEVIDKNGGIYHSVSATTRSPREGETDGADYHFVSRAQFEELIKSGQLLEHAEYCGNYYGTPEKPVRETLDKGLHVVLEIEVQGALKIKEKCPEAVFVFILPPSLEELKNRLLKRGTETEESVARRISEAENELKASAMYDYAIVNDILEKAAEDLKAVIRAEELRIKK